MLPPFSALKGKVSKKRARRRQQADLLVPSQRRLDFIGQQCAIYQKTELLIIIAVRTSGPKWKEIFHPSPVYAFDISIYKCLSVFVKKFKINCKALILNVLRVCRFHFWENYHFLSGISNFPELRQYYNPISCVGSHFNRY
jgi:hypothetical protein